MSENKVNKNCVRNTFEKYTYNDIDMYWKNWIATKRKQNINLN
jgi:hypothetical protein